MRIVAVQFIGGGIRRNKKPAPRRNGVAQSKRSSVTKRRAISGPPATMKVPMIRVRFAPSPTGYLHIGSARTFIFNWLYARRNGGTMILRIDDTDIERNTEASLNSIFEGLNWLGLGWDEQYRQSERLALHKQFAESILARGLAYRDFTPPNAAGAEKDEAQHAAGAWRSNPGQREMSREESDRRAAAGEKFVVRFRVPRDIAEDVSSPRRCLRRPVQIHRRHRRLRAP